MAKKKSFDPAKVNAFIGCDIHGDACVYFHMVDDDGDHVRFLTKDEIEQYAACILR